MFSELTNSSMTETEMIVYVIPRAGDWWWTESKPILEQSMFCLHMFLS